jgi:hypothetical protein
MITYEIITWEEDKSNCKRLRIEAFQSPNDLMEFLISLRSNGSIVDSIKLLSWGNAK